MQMQVLTLARHHALCVALGQQPRVAVEAGLLHFRRDAPRGEGGIIAAAEMPGGGNKPRCGPTLELHPSRTANAVPKAFLPQKLGGFLPSLDAPPWLFPPGVATKCRGLGSHHGGPDSKAIMVAQIGGVRDQCTVWCWWPWSIPRCLDGGGRHGAGT